MTKNPEELNMHHQILDYDGTCKHQVCTTVNKRGVFLEVEGFGVKHTKADTPIGNGYQQIVGIECVGGQLCVVVRSDINESEPTHVILLEGARAEYYKEDAGV